MSNDSPKENNSESKKFKPFGGNFSWKSPGVIAFVLLFAAIGGYLIYKGSAASPQNPVRILAGYSGSNVTDSNGEIWKSDTGYFTGGKTFSVANTIDIKNTTDDNLYRSSRSGTNGAGFSYNVKDLANGTYNVKLHLAELWNDQYGTNCVTGKRTFSVTGNGTPILTNFDLFSTAGCRTAYITSGTDVTVSNGTLVLNFTRGNTGSDPNPMVNAIEIVPVLIEDEGDSAAPTVAITAPANNATVMGTVNMNATANDNVGVTKVEFAVDSNAPVTDTSAPYSYAWDTKTATNGSHVLKATAFDAAGNSKSATVNVTVNNVVAPPPPTASTVRIIAGYTGADYKDSKGNTWTKDNYSVNGKTYTSPNTIKETNDPTLFKQSRSGSSGNVLNYIIPVTSGDYKLTLNFAEVWAPNCTANKRTFNVNAEAETLLRNYDIFANAGCETANSRTFPIKVSDGALNLAFSAGTSGASDPNPIVNSIEIVPATTGGGETDTTAPTVPGNLTGSALSDTQVQLSWNASTDNVGVAKYNVYRDGGTTPIGTSTTRTDFLDSGLAAYSNHTYTVEACDTAGNCSNKTAAVSVRTRDITLPSVPSNVTANGTSSTAVNLTWSASTDTGSGLNGYNVYRNGTKVANNISATSYSDSGLSPSTTYSYVVEACDKATPTNNCVRSSAVSGTTQAATDTTPPSAPGNFRATVNSSTQITLNWNASTDSESPSGITYTITRNGTPVASNLTGLSYVNSGLTASTTYQYGVTAKNSVNLVSSASSVSATTQSAPDTSAPSVPANLNGTAVSASQINLTWSASTDTGGSGLAGYNVYRNGTKINSSLVNSTSYGDSGLSANTAYSYTVSAVDGANNQSAQSAAKSVTTQNTTPPPTGANCTSTVSPGSLSSVASAFNSLTSGGVLCLRGGTYTGSGVTLSKSGTSSSRLTIKSYPGEVAVMNASGQSISKTSDILTIGGSYVTYSDIEMKNSTGRALRTTGSNILVSNNRIHDIQYNGILDAGSNNIIEGNEVWRTVLSNTNGVLGSSGWAEAINTFGSTNTIMRNNEIYDSWGEGIDYINSNGGVAEGNLVYRNFSVQIYLDGSSNVTVRNNKLGENIPGATRGIYGVQMSSEGGRAFSNNLITGNYFYSNSGISTSWGIPAGSTYTLSGNFFGCNSSYTGCRAASNGNN